MRRILAGIAGVLAGLLPVAACPACWPAYASVLSSLGISVVGFGTGHLLTVSILLSFAIGMLAFDAYRSRRYKPLILGMLGAVAVLTSNLMSPSQVSSFASYGGSALLLCATILNVARNRQQITSSCDCQDGSSNCGV